MKQLSIPYIPDLHTLDQDTLNETLEDQGAGTLVNAVNWAQFSYKPMTTVHAAYSQEHLFIRFHVHGNCLRAVNYTNNSPVYEDSCVEFFVQHEGADSYFNFEFNCIGTCLASKRVSREDKNYLSDQQIDSIIRFASLGKKPFMEMEGIFAWELIVGIPFSCFEVNPKQLPDKMRANFYKCADLTELPHYVSWSPIDTEEPNFHVPRCFGEIFFEK